MEKTHFDSNLIFETIGRLFSSFSIKSFTAVFFLFFSWVFEGDTKVLLSICALTILDVVTGVSYAIKSKSLSSRGFYRTAVKWSVYMTMIVVSRIVDKHVPVQFASPVMDAFLVTTEALSILENLNKCGFPVPTVLVDKLKVYWEKK